MHGINTIRRNNNVVANRQLAAYEEKAHPSPDWVLDRAKKILAYRLNRPESPAFSSSDVAKQYLKLCLAHQEREVFACLFLDTRHRLISYDELFYGTIDASVVHPREVVKAALQRNAAAVILAHNHPSGNPEPSRGDEAITGLLKDALGLIDVRVLDHIVVGSDEPVSFAERGLL